MDWRFCKKQPKDGIIQDYKEGDSLETRKHCQTTCCNWVIFNYGEIFNLALLEQFHGGWLISEFVANKVHIFLGDEINQNGQIEASYQSIPKAKITWKQDLSQNIC